MSGAWTVLLFSSFTGLEYDVKSKWIWYSNLDIICYKSDLGDEKYDLERVLKLYKAPSQLTPCHSMGIFDSNKPGTYIWCLAFKFALSTFHVVRTSYL